MARKNSDQSFTVTVKNWHKWNPTSAAKSHSWFKVSTHFFDDPKVSRMNATDTVLLLYIYTRCADHQHHTVVIDTSHARHRCRLRTDHILTSAMRLEELQLVTLENFPKKPPREEKKREEKSREEKIQPKSKSEPEASPESLRSSAIIPDIVEPSSTHEFLKAYCEAYKARYKNNPVITGPASGIAKRIVKAIGVASPDLVRTFVSMNDSWFVTKGHDLDTMEKNLNKIKTKHETGVHITRLEANNLESSDATRNQMERVMRGEL